MKLPKGKIPIVSKYASKDKMSSKHIFHGQTTQMIHSKEDSLLRLIAIAKVYNNSWLKCNDKIGDDDEKTTNWWKS